MLSRRCPFKLLVVIFIFSVLLLLITLNLKDPQRTGHVKNSYEDNNALLTDLLRSESPHRVKIHQRFYDCAKALGPLLDVNNKTVSGTLLNCFLVAMNLKSDQYSHSAIAAVPDKVKKFLSLPIINPHNPEYLIDSSNACSDHNVKTLFVSPSAPDFFERRHVVRKSNRGRFVKDITNNSTLLFFIGLPSNQNLKLIDELKTEAKTFGDIVLVNFEDKYKNILKKALAMLRWSIDYCPSAQYVIRTDDDVNVTVTDLISVMKDIHKTHQNFIVGKRMVGDVPARSNNKWHLSVEEYPESTLPTYVLGGLIGYPMTTVQLLYEASLRLKSIWLDDVYITGLCSKQLNIPVLEDKRFVFEHKLKPGDIPGQV